MLRVIFQQLRLFEGASMKNARVVFQEVLITHELILQQNCYVSQTGFW